MKNILIMLFLSIFCLRCYADDTIYTCPNVVICKNNQCKSGADYDNTWEYTNGFLRFKEKYDIQHLHYTYQFKNGVYIFEKAQSGMDGYDRPAFPVTSARCYYQGLQMPLFLISKIALKAYGTAKWDDGTSGYCYNRGDSSYCTMKAMF